MPRDSWNQYKWPSTSTGEETFDPREVFHSMREPVTSPLPPARTAIAVFLRPPMTYTIPSSATAVGQI
ncbi:MAG: hypothetical protein BWZ10_03304 [candidate division BRC1 bacterium ADurb.BinA364]|nr:MAG: hypothetical protein BWZ10_03304 [candidate division BRC1 bacterium ADurb.BinA364]